MKHDTRLSREVRALNRSRWIADTFVQLGVWVGFLLLAYLAGQFLRGAF